MTTRREVFTALGLVLLGAALVLLAASRTWLSASSVIPDFPVARVHVSGGEASPLTRALGYVALAGVVALLATRRWGRQLVGGLLALTGAGVVVAGAIFWSLDRLIAESALERVMHDPSLSVYAKDVATTGWPIVAMIGGLLVAVGGVLALLRGRRWPVMGSRYDAPGVRRRTDTDPWAALDRGEDPTVQD
ncbi:Trp biosynthesis-associated membrane protein [Actinopolymorpha alba]|uniref:Trp biosynthesis-associated membrane protein n=1 Tax=Actinopolymorpha alba TaxID=533267 RepID=UPI00036127DF|nr:Trp biosynthesis-associated membrane protein [Actinopolymorpha alba]